MTAKMLIFAFLCVFYGVIVHMNKKAGKSVRKNWRQCFFDSVVIVD